MPLNDSWMAATSLRDALDALVPLVRDAEAALDMIQQRLQISWAGKGGERFDRWHPMLHKGGHAPTDYPGFRAYEAFAAFMPGFKESYEIVAASILAEIAVLLPRAHGAPSPVQGAAALTNLYHTLEDAIEVVEARWVAVLACSKSALHLYEMPDALVPLSAKIRRVVQASYELYKGPLGKRAQLVRSLRAVLCLLSCNVGDPYNHYDAMHADVNTCDIDTFMALREVDLLQHTVNHAAGHPNPVEVPEELLDDSFLEGHVHSVVSFLSGGPPPAELVDALRTRILFVHSLPLPSEPMDPVPNSDNRPFNMFSMEILPNLDEARLADWSILMMPPAFDSVPMTSAHWSATPVDQDSFTNVAAFHERACARERKQQLRDRALSASPGESPMEDPSSDEEETVVLEIRRASRALTPPPVILVDPLLPPVDPVEPSNIPPKPWGERDAWYIKSEIPSASRAPYLHSRSRSRSPPRRDRSAGRKRSHMRAFYPCN